MVNLINFECGAYSTYIIWLFLVNVLSHRHYQSLEKEKKNTADITILIWLNLEINH